jgi:hypothetical protein
MKKCHMADLMAVTFLPLFASYHAPIMARPKTPMKDNG